jgi:NAD(P)H-dependent nitrite reductase small subunit
MSDLSKAENDPWQRVCTLEDLPLDAGVAALVNQDAPQETQIAIFRQRNSADVYAIGNFDPFSEANVLARGILCSIDGELAVASPVLKEHFSLTTGQCFEDEAVSVPTYPTKVSGGQVFVQLAPGTGEEL